MEPCVRGARIIPVAAKPRSGQVVRPILLHAPLDALWGCDNDVVEIEAICIRHKLDRVRSIREREWRALDVGPHLRTARIRHRQRSGHVDAIHLDMKAFAAIRRCHACGEYIVSSRLNTNIVG